MSYTITRRTLTPQPVLIGRRKVDRSGIAKAISELLPKVFQHAQANGFSIVGPPFARYSEMSGGTMTIEPGMPVSVPAAGGGETTGGDVHLDMLPGGQAACTMHAGHYDQLQEAYQALERWMLENGVKAAGAPWESYLTDPGQTPDPKDFRTEVVWPIR